MQLVLQILLIVALIAVVLVLFTGLASFVVGGEFNRRYANKIMRLRVAAQAVAIGLALVILLLRTFGNN